jgi:hypothetical protein
MRLFCILNLPADQADNSYNPVFKEPVQLILIIIEVLGIPKIA